MKYDIYIMWKSYSYTKHFWGLESFTDNLAAAATHELIAAIENSF